MNLFIDILYFISTLYVIGLVGAIMRFFFTIGSSNIDLTVRTFRYELLRCIALCVLFPWIVLSYPVLFIVRFCGLWEYKNPEEIYEDLAKFFRDIFFDR